jgi:hypothetical protein
MENIVKEPSICHGSLCMVGGDLIERGTLPNDENPHPSADRRFVI